MKHKRIEEIMPHLEFLRKALGFFLLIAISLSSLAQSDERRFAEINRMDEAEKISIEVTAMRSCGIAEEDISKFVNIEFENTKRKFGQELANRYRSALLSDKTQEAFIGGSARCYEQLISAGKRIQKTGVELALATANAKTIPRRISSGGENAIGIMMHFESTARDIYLCAPNNFERTTAIEDIKNNVTKYLDSRLGPGASKRMLEREKDFYPVLATGNSDNNRKGLLGLCGLLTYIAGMNLELSEQLANPLPGEKGRWLDKKLRGI